MNTFKAEVNKIILALTSVGLLILLIFPASLSADHFRYGTMSWELVDNDTIRIKMQIGWSYNWHTWSYINVSPDLEGMWKIVVTDTLNIRYDSLSFKIKDISLQ